MKKFSEYHRLNESEESKKDEEFMDAIRNANSNYVVSYTKDRGIDFDASISAYDMYDLIVKMKKSMSESEFASIYKIEIGTFA